MRRNPRLPAGTWYVTELCFLIHFFKFLLPFSLLFTLLLSGATGDISTQNASTNVTLSSSPLALFSLNSASVSLLLGCFQTSLFPQLLDLFSPSRFISRKTLNISLWNLYHASFFYKSLLVKRDHNIKGYIIGISAHLNAYPKSWFMCNSNISNNIWGRMILYPHAWELELFWGNRDWDECYTTSTITLRSSDYFT